MMDDTTRIRVEGDFVQTPETFVHGPTVDATEYVGSPIPAWETRIESSEAQLAEQTPE
jgi:hypothetical protein